MTDVPLLNPTGGDSRCSLSILKEIKGQKEAAERDLLGCRCHDLQEYTAAFTRAETLRNILKAAEDIFGKHYRI